MYKVVRQFFDLQDENYQYFLGDAYPRVGGVATPKRVEELMSSNNRQGVPLIAEVREEKTAEGKPKKASGGGKTKKTDF